MSETLAMAVWPSRRIRSPAASPARAAADPARTSVTLSWASGSMTRPVFSGDGYRQTDPLSNPPAAWAERTSISPIWWQWMHSDPLPCLKVAYAE